MLAHDGSSKETDGQLCQSLQASRTCPRGRAGGAAGPARQGTRVQARLLLPHWHPRRGGQHTWATRPLGHEPRSPEVRPVRRTPRHFGGVRRPLTATRHGCTRLLAPTTPAAPIGAESLALELPSLAFPFPFQACRLIKAPLPTEARDLCVPAAIVLENGRTPSGDAKDRVAASGAAAAAGLPDPLRPPLCGPAVLLMVGAASGSRPERKLAIRCASLHPSFRLCIPPSSTLALLSKPLQWTSQPLPLAAAQHALTLWMTRPQIHLLPIPPARPTPWSRPQASTRLAALT